MKLRNFIKLLILSIFLTKIFFNIFVDFNKATTKLFFTLSKDQSQGVVYDDKEIAYSGLMYAKGLGFVTNVYFDRPAFNKLIIHKTALRPKALIIFHSITLKIYYSYFEIDLFKSSQIPENYFQLYGLVICIIKNILLAVSMTVFFSFSKLLMNELWGYFALLAYLVFPSVLYFIGDLNFLDNIVMPLNVIFWGILILELDLNRKKRYYSFVFLGFIFLVLCLIKPHHFLLIVFLNVAMIANYIKNGKIQDSLFGILIIDLIVIIGFSPILISNYQDFHSVFISTQSGFNLFHGHNTACRGSWNPNIWEEYGQIINPILKSNLDLPMLNEKEESDFYKKLALDWAFANPLLELKLIFRKTLIYFIPYNFMNFKVNFYNAVIYILSSISIVYFSLNAKKTNKLIFLIFVPVISIYLINILYFVEFRWRYYAEPFMVFLSVYFIWTLKAKIKNLVLFNRDSNV